MFIVPVEVFVFFLVSFWQSGAYLSFSLVLLHAIVTIFLSRILSLLLSVSSSPDVTFPFFIPFFLMLF